MKSALAEGLRFTQEWYGAYVGKTNLPLWISGAKGIVDIVLGQKAEDRKYVVTFSSDPGVIGSIEIVNPNLSKITIGCIFLSADLLLKAEVEAAMGPIAIIGCSNGTVAHEAAHLRYDTMTLYADELNKVVNWKRSIFGAAFNVIEDLFIEAAMRAEFTAMSNFITMKNAFLFNESYISETIANVNWESPESILQLAVLAKELRGEWISRVERVCPSGAPFKKLWAILEGAMDAKLTAEQRASAAHELVDFILRTTHVTEGDSETTIPGNGRNGIESLERMLGSEVGSALTAKASHAARWDKNTIDTVEFLSTMDSVAETPTKLPILIKRASAGNLDIDIDPDFEGIEKLLSRMSVPTTTFGPAKNAGRLMTTRLSRIATDGKVFADPVDTAKFDMGIEVVILVDGSGSMVSGAPKRRMSLFAASLSAAITMKLGLDSVRIATSVWAHSGDTSKVCYVRNLTLIEVAGSRPMSKATMRRQASWTNTSDMMLCQNRDGDAIRWCGNNAFKSANRRVLIVLSDGVPMAGNYRGQSAIDHTKYEIALLRNAGVAVISISLTPGIVNKNSMIYGQRFNVDASSGDIARAIAMVIVANTRKQKA